MIQRFKNSSELLRSTGILVALLIVAAVVLKLSAGDPKADPWWEQAPPGPAPGAAPTKNTKQAVTDSSGSAAARSRSRSAEDSSAAPGSLQSARDLVDQGRWSEAEKLLAGFLKQNPQNEAALVEMAMIQMLDKQDSAAAKTFLEQAFAINTQNEVVVHELLRVYQENRGWEEGLRFMRSLPGESPYVSFGIGSILFELKRPVEAAEVLHRTVYESGYQGFDARETLAEALWTAGRGDEAIQELEALIEGPYKVSEVKTAKIRLASVLMERGQTDEARTILQALQEADPSDEWVAYLMGQLNDARF